MQNVWHVMMCWFHWRLLNAQDIPRLRSTHNITQRDGFKSSMFPCHHWTIWNGFTTAGYSFEVSSREMTLDPTSFRVSITWHPIFMAELVGKIYGKPLSLEGNPSLLMFAVDFLLIFDLQTNFIEPNICAGRTQKIFICPLPAASWLCTDYVTRWENAPARVHRAADETEKKKSYIMWCKFREFTKRRASRDHVSSPFLSNYVANIQFTRITRQTIQKKWMKLVCMVNHINLPCL